MKRTKLSERILPTYSRGEDIFNMVSHIVGGALGIAYLALAVIFAAIHGDPWAVVASSIYGASTVFLFTMSSVYHGVKPPMARRVLQIIDHCTIYVMIAGTYTPFTLCSLRRESAPLGWTIFGIVWGFAALAITLNAIDLKKYQRFSMICYLGMGWCIIFTLKPLLAAIGLTGGAFLFIGGVLYTIGAVLYGLGKKKRYAHALFHVFVVLGSLLHFFCIFFYVI